jgi:hypothetical protein
MTPRTVEDRTGDFSASSTGFVKRTIVASSRASVNRAPLSGGADRQVWRPHVTVAWRRLGTDATGDMCII